MNRGPLMLGVLRTSWSSEPQAPSQHCKGEPNWYAEALEASPSDLASLKASSSWRMTAPVRSWQGGGPHLAMAG